MEDIIKDQKSRFLEIPKDIQDSRIAAGCSLCEHEGKMNMEKLTLNEFDTLHENAIITFRRNSRIIPAHLLP